MFKYLCWGGISNGNDDAMLSMSSFHWQLQYYNDVIMSVIASQTTGDSIYYSTVFFLFFFCADQRWYRSSASLAFVRGSHRWPVNSPRKRPVTGKMFPFDDVVIHRDEIICFTPFNCEKMVAAFFLQITWQHCNNKSREIGFTLCCCLLRDGTVDFARIL